MHRQSSTVARLLAKKQRTYFAKYLAEGGHRKFLGHFKSHWLKEVVRNSWDILKAISVHKESHGSHGNFYEREQEQCNSVSAEVLHGVLVMCWRHFGWNHLPAKSVKNFSWFLILRDSISSSSPKDLFLSNFIPQYCSTASMVLSVISCSHSICKCLQLS